MRRSGDVIRQRTEQGNDMAEAQTIEVVALVSISALKDVKQMRVLVRAEQALCPSPNGHPEQPLHRSTPFEEGAEGISFLRRLSDLTFQDAQPLANLCRTINPL